MLHVFHHMLVGNVHEHPIPTYFQVREKLKSAVDRANSFENDLELMREQVGDKVRLICVSFIFPFLRMIEFKLIYWFVLVTVRFWELLHGKRCYSSTEFALLILLNVLSSMVFVNNQGFKTIMKLTRQTAGKILLNIAVF